MPYLPYHRLTRRLLCRANVINNRLVNWRPARAKRLGSRLYFRLYFNIDIVIVIIAITFFPRYINHQCQCLWLSLRVLTRDLSCTDVFHWEDIQKRGRNFESRVLLSHCSMASSVFLNNLSYFKKLGVFFLHCKHIILDFNLCNVWLIKLYTHKFRSMIRLLFRFVDILLEIIFRIVEKTII